MTDIEKISDELEEFCIACRKQLLHTKDVANPRAGFFMTDSLYCGWPTCKRYGLDTILFLRAANMTTFGK